MAAWAIARSIDTTGELYVSIPSDEAAPSRAEGERSHAGEDAFFFLVERLIASARLILNLREIRIAHSIWREELEPQLRPNLLKLVRDERVIDRARSQAKCDVLLAEEGYSRVGTSRYLRSVPPLEKRLERAEARLNEARAALQASSDAIRRAQDLLIGRKVRSLGSDFAHLQREYESAFQKHRVVLTRASTGELPQVAEWDGASHCEVVSKLARAVVELVHDDDPDGLSRHYLGQRLRRIRHQDWDRLRNVALREAAAVPPDSDLLRVGPGSQRGGDRGEQKAEITNDALIASQATPKEKPSAALNSSRGARGSRPPRPEVIDATARDSLQKAMQAAADAGHAYIPNREALAGAVSKALEYTIKVPSLFGTKNVRGTRAARYPGFMSLWDSVQTASRDARRSKTRR